ncbi:MAG: hypothetical protein AABP62_19500, partial [Planctomycetota bacterium]
RASFCRPKNLSRILGRHFADRKTSPESSGVVLQTKKPLPNPRASFSGPLKAKPDFSRELYPRDTASHIVSSGPGDLEESHELGAGFRSACEILGPGRLQRTPAGQFGRTIEV